MAAVLIGGQRRSPATSNSDVSRVATIILLAVAIAAM